MTFLFSHHPIFLGQSLQHTAFAPLFTQLTNEAPHFAPPLQIVLQKFHPLYAIFNTIFVNYYEKALKYLFWSPILRPPAPGDNCPPCLPPVSPAAGCPELAHNSNISLTEYLPPFGLALSVLRPHAYDPFTVLRWPPCSTFLHVPNPHWG